MWSKRLPLPFAGLAGLMVMVLAASTAQAMPIEFTATLNGPSESLPNASPGTGFAVVDFDKAADTMRVRVDFTGLTTGTTASHIHAVQVYRSSERRSSQLPCPPFRTFRWGDERDL